MSLALHYTVKILFPKLLRLTFLPYSLRCGYKVNFNVVRSICYCLYFASLHILVDFNYLHVDFMCEIVAWFKESEPYKKVHLEKCQPYPHHLVPTLPFFPPISSELNKCHLFLVYPSYNSHCPMKHILHVHFLISLHFLHERYHMIFFHALHLYHGSHPISVYRDFSHSFSDSFITLHCVDVP